MKIKLPFFLIASLIMLSVMFASFERYHNFKDYWINTEVPCDPSIDSCFVYECDSERGECTENPEEDVSYYKKLSILAQYTPVCDPQSEDCPIKDCKNISNDFCKITPCDSEDLKEGEVCITPEEYNAQVEESATPEDQDTEVDSSNNTTEETE